MEIKEIFAEAKLKVAHSLFLGLDFFPFDLDLRPTLYLFVFVFEGTINFSFTDFQIDATLDSLIKGCPRLRVVTLIKWYFMAPLTPELLANLEAFKAKLLAKNPNAVVFVLSEREAFFSPFSLLSVFVFSTQRVEREFAEREGSVFLCATGRGEERKNVVSERMRDAFFFFEELVPQQFWFSCFFFLLLPHPSPHESSLSLPSPFPNSTEEGRKESQHEKIQEKKETTKPKKRKTKKNIFFAISKQNHPRSAAVATLSSPKIPGPAKKSHDASQAPSRFLCPEDHRCAGLNLQGARSTDFCTWSNK